MSQHKEDIEREILTKLCRPYTIVWEDGKPYKKSEIWKVDVIDKIKSLYDFRNKVIGSQKSYKEITKEIAIWEKYLESLDY